MSRPPRLPPLSPVHPRTSASIGPTLPMAAAQLLPLGPHPFPSPGGLFNPDSRSLPPLFAPSFRDPPQQLLPPRSHQTLAHTDSSQPYVYPSSWIPQERAPAPAPLERLLLPDMHSAPSTRSPISARDHVPISPGVVLGSDVPLGRPPTQWYHGPPRMTEYPEPMGRIPPRDDGKAPGPSPVSPIHSTPRSSASSFSSPRIPPDRFAIRPPYTQRSSSGISTYSNPPKKQDSVTNPYSVALAATADTSPNRYRLTIRQQPIAARACGQGERDRRTIDPPPILQLTLTDYDPESPEDIAKLQWPMNIVHCALHSTQDTQNEDVSTIKDPNNSGRQSRRLMGTLVANPFTGIDPEAPASNSENARKGCFFIFHDLSCRQNGLYRLHFTLVSVNVDALAVGGRVPTIATVESDVFEVFSAKDFPGMKSSSLLTRSLKAQGANVQVKKGSEVKGPLKGRKRALTESEDDGSVGEVDDSSEVRKKKRKS